MTLVDKLNELGRDLEIGYEDKFSEKPDQHKLGEAIDSVLWPVQKKLSSDKLKYLYHYTSQQAAFSIIKTRMLRATDAYFLNDISEIKHGADAFKKALEKLKATDSERYNIIKSPVEFLTNPFSEEKQDAYAIHRGNAYVVSLSTKGDDVSQWQKYAVHHGVALGFRIDLLSEATFADFNSQKSGKNEASDIESLLAPVMYGTVDGLADLVFEDMRSLKLNGSSYSRELRNKLIERYACFSSLMKHPSFSSECEWRLLLTQAQVNRDEVCWHPGEAYAKPYVNLGFAEKGKDWHKTSAIQASGLRTYCDIRINAQDYSLARHYYDFIGMDVSKSDTPLRPQQD